MFLAVYAEEVMVTIREGNAVEGTQLIIAEGVEGKIDVG